MQIAPQDDKARIAAEVAARYGIPVNPDAVQIIPRGVSGMPLEGISWKASGPIMMRHYARQRKFEALAARERKAEQVAVIEAAPRVVKAAPVPKVKKAKVMPPRPAEDPRLVAARERLARVMAFAGEGDKTVAEIADFLGVNDTAARAYIRRMAVPFRAKIKIVPKSERDPAKGYCTKREESAARAADARAERDARRPKVSELFWQGLSAKRIAEILGITRNMAELDIKALGLSAKDRSVMRKERPAAKVKERRGMTLEQKRAACEVRRERVKELRASGRQIKDIADALGAKVGTINSDLLALGLTTNNAGHVGNPTMVGQVKAMRARKMSIREIAAALNIAKSTVVRMYQAGGAA